MFLRGLEQGCGGCRRDVRRERTDREGWRRWRRRAERPASADKTPGGSAIHNACSDDAFR